MPLWSRQQALVVQLHLYNGFEHSPHMNLASNKSTTVEQSQSHLWGATMTLLSYLFYQETSLYN